MKEIKLLELFSGIGGFAKGFEDAGYKIIKHQFSEIDNHAIANYLYNFKNAEYIGSVTDVRGKRGQADVITFGSPCQDFSIAGKGEGMEGQRSRLILEAIRLISEIQPGVFIWENVKGAFSSNNGQDFWAILNAFTNIGNYRLEWQLLNTSWFLPQNRERIYLVGHLAGRSEPGIFPFTEDDKLFNKQKQSERGWAQAKYCTTLKASGAMKADDTFIEIPKKASCITGGGNSGGLHSDMTVIPVITPNRKNKRQNGRRFKEDGDPVFTLNCQDQHGIMFTKNYLQWDESGKGYKSQQDRAHYEAGIMGCIPSTRTENKVNVLTKQHTIRRLTEIECERLQGFPDDWTKYGLYEKQVWINKNEKTFKIIKGINEIPKTQRYKMCGNAASTVAVKAIALRLNIK